jgi:hypothetical protein
MLEPTRDRAPTSVAENIEKMAQVENDALRPRTHRAAITDATGGFAGTIYFVVLQLAVFGGWVGIVTATSRKRCSPSRDLVSGRSDRGLPPCRGFGSKGPQSGSGDEMTLMVKVVVNGGVKTEEALR